LVFFLEVIWYQPFSDLRSSFVGKWSILSLLKLVLCPGTYGMTFYLEKDSSRELKWLQYPSLRKSPSSSGISASRFSSNVHEAVK
jgi:hypothetical protein